jgi:hypothetical protein
MTSEMASEAMEVITMAVDKHQTTKNYEVSMIFFLRYLQIIFLFIGCRSIN